MNYKLFFSNEHREAILYEQSHPDNVAGVFTAAKDKIILFSFDYSKMSRICSDCGIPYKFIRRTIDEPISVDSDSPWYLCVWGYYGDLVLAKFDNVQMNLFPEIPGIRFEKLVGE